MYLREWKPILRAHSATLWIEISLEANLQCPVCRQHVDISIHKNNLPQRNLFPNVLSSIELAVAELNMLRTCKKCGTPSQLPIYDLERLIQKIHKLITEEWLNTQVALLNRSNGIQSKNPVA